MLQKEEENTERGRTQKIRQMRVYKYQSEPYAYIVYPKFWWVRKKAMNNPPFVLLNPLIFSTYHTCLVVYRRRWTNHHRIQKWNNSGKTGYRDFSIEWPVSLKCIKSLFLIMFEDLRFWGKSMNELCTISSQWYAYYMKRQDKILITSNQKNIHKSRIHYQQTL